MASAIAQLLTIDDKDDSLVGAIVAWIGSAIIEGDLPPGADLNSVDLAKRFNTSRTPVREALLRLEKEGLIMIPPRRRPYVTPLSILDARDIFEIRSTLLSFAASRAAINASQSDIERLRDVQHQHRAAREAKDAKMSLWSTVQFEDTIIEISGNAALRRTLAPVRLKTLRFWYILLRENPRSRNTYDIARLVQAIGDHEPNLAAELYRSIIGYTMRRIEEKDWSQFDSDRRRKKRRVPGVA